MTEGSHTVTLWKFEPLINVGYSDMFPQLESGQSLVISLWAPSKLSPRPPHTREVQPCIL